MSLSKSSTWMSHPDWGLSSTWGQRRTQMGFKNDGKMILVFGVFWLQGCASIKKPQYTPRTSHSTLGWDPPWSHDFWIQTFQCGSWHTGHFCLSPCHPSCCLWQSDSGPPSRWFSGAPEIETLWVYTKQFLLINLLLTRWNRKVAALWCYLTGKVQIRWSLERFYDSRSRRFFNLLLCHNRYVLVSFSNFR